MVPSRALLLVVLLGVSATAATASAQEARLVPAPMTEFPKAMGWNVTLDPTSGRGVATRNRRPSMPAFRGSMIGVGIATLVLAHWVPPALNVALTSRYDIGPIDTIVSAMVPFGWIGGAAWFSGCSSERDASYYCSVDLNWRAIWIVSGLLRVAGTILIGVGAGYGKRTLEVVPFTLSAAPIPGGGVVSAIGRF